MARTINILPEHLARKIAAGEVVQRPESVVKELIENAIDAQARSVTVVIRKAGKSFIQVSDDGIGMSAEDALTAFERHATSKIASDEDLGHIETLGFRGEALASIAAVAQVELKTRLAMSATGGDVRGDALGTRIRIAGGVRELVEPVAMEAGTSVTVRNLFYNTPARRKFLKSDATEFKHIFETVQRTAMAWHEVAFTFVNDDEIILDVQSTPTYEQRIRDLLGEEFFGSLIPVNEGSGSLRIHGFVSKPQFARKTRTEQIFFLNRRFITSRVLSHAVYSAYEHLVEKGSFPFFVLFLEIDPSRVDVNVHPSKLEVKFDDESGVYRQVLHTVRGALSSHDLAPPLELAGDKRFSSSDAVEQGTGDQMGSRTEMHLAFMRKELQSEKASVFPSSFRREAKLSIIPLPHEIPVSTRSGAGVVDQEEPRIWQLHNKYILSQVKSGLVIIDQHAAHERILYERAVEMLESNAPLSQQLLFPQTVELPPADFALVTELMSELQRLGFDLQIFGKNTILVSGIPADVRIGYEARILQDILDEYRDDRGEVSLSIRDRLAKSFACRAAIKAGDPLSLEEMRSLIDQLFATSIPYSCPHGRPVIVKLSLEEFDKFFGRT
ncbi:MAG: DNA mismatch repair endonuclease MutL [Bacteroidota bacterium]